MRSTLDEHGVCDACRPGVADGTVILRRVGRDTVTALPVAVHPAPPVAECVTICPCTGEPVGTGDCDGECNRTADEPVIATQPEPKQRPVKRRWYRRIGRR